jgi:hypothetical protein
MSCFLLNGIVITLIANPALRIAPITLSIFEPFAVMAMLSR